MKSVRPILFFFALLFVQKVNGQNIKLETLLKIYNGNSLTYAFNLLQTIPNFKGQYSSGINSSDSSIKGKINDYDFKAWKQAKKIAMSFFFDDEEIFARLKGDANKSLRLQETTSAISGGVKRNHFVFSNVRKMKLGELEVILTKCTVIDSNKIYFQVDILDNR